MTNRPINDIIGQKEVIDVKNFLKFLAFTVVIVMALAALASCGATAEIVESEDEPVETTPKDTGVETEEEKEVTGEVTEVEGYAVLVPEGFDLKMPGEFSPYDFEVQKGDFHYYDFNVKDDDEGIMQHYNYNKNTYTNEQKDVAATYGDNEWTGFQYSDGWGGYGFEAYCEIGGKLVRVSSAGAEFDSAEAAAILASLTVK